MLDVLEPGWSPVEYLFLYRWQGARMDEAFTGQAAWWHGRCKGDER